ncbi:MAG: glutamine synthetase [Lentisphaerae bacterium GWF2_45_14]|nr:MAG: glutamine synthetase [Lentisphaerae bacterium GWF2_45_14]
MTSQRRRALSNIASRKCEDKGSGMEKPVTEIYGEEVFNLKTMKDFLPKPVYIKLLNTIREGAPLDQSIADDIANAMKRWALEKGASHYTHWFQPLTGATAEKHDSFIEPDAEGGVMMHFSGKSLTKGEPDASSFPSGGLRATFEARGYTAWDPTSPAFIKRGRNSATLCIPTAFCSYKGEALDKKTPLLRSIQAVSKHAKRLLMALGEKNSVRVNASLGAEQEYFLVDKELFMARPDLLQTDRTLFGNVPAKHQQMEDHYFATIRPRILSFMADVDTQLWKLGIPAKTRHNEVAPAQFEIAPVFEEANLAVDHNMLVMETLKQVADEHGLVCILHEKPFAGINGSGKHNNWSLGISDGRNILEPGSNPHENAIFLTFLGAIIQAVDLHADLIRASVASASNDHRLGANEAPPAIISIYLGEELTEVIESLQKGKASGKAKTGGFMHIGVDALPLLPMDTSDRNRTSPFAFTGNKFEFRAAGSKQSCAGPNMVLNTIVAEALDEIATKLEKAPAGKRIVELQDIFISIVKKHGRVIFNGDNYSKEWEKEAAKRGLHNMKTTPEALKCIVSKENIKLFEKYKVLSGTELHSRYEIFMEEYHKTIMIEGKVGLNIVKTMIFPAAVKQQAILLENLIKLKTLGIKAGAEPQKKNLELVGKAIEDLSSLVSRLEKGIVSHDTASILKELVSARTTVDALELSVDDELWPLPKYSELLFMY